MSQHKPIDTNEPLLARGFWGPRPETPEQIADKLLAFITGLDDATGENIQWTSHELPEQLLTEPDVTKDLVSKAFLDNTDAPHLGITQVYDARSKMLGNVSISMSVGGYSESQGIRNTFVIKWRGADQNQLAIPILHHLASIWDPDWADVTSISLIRALADIRPIGKRVPSTGYLTYFSEARAQTLPSGIRHVANLENGGIIIGASESNDFYSVDKVRELAETLSASPASAETPTSRSKL